MSNILKSCTLCPRNCKVNRYEQFGYCKAPGKLKLALASLHNWEEPCISGDFGSGTIFFSNCNMGCVYCQNYKISSGYGKMITVKRFAQICIELQNKKAHNINLVTPTPYVPLIIKGIREAKRLGLYIPIVYNTSSYENVETIKMLNKTVDIYLADLKYYEDKYAVKYSNTSNYFEYATKAIEEMYNQVGTPIIKNGLMINGEVKDIAFIQPILKRNFDSIYKSLQLFGNITDGYIMLTGGGSLLLQKPFKNRLNNIIMTDKPQWDNVNGFKVLGDNKYE